MVTSIRWRTKLTTISVVCCSLGGVSPIENLRTEVSQFPLRRFNSQWLRTGRESVVRRVRVWFSIRHRFGTFSPMNKTEPLVIVDQVEKVYSTGQHTVEARRGISLEVLPGEFVALMGPPGCGKSTLLHLIGGRDRPTHGRVLVGGTVLETLSETALALFRRREKLRTSLIILGISLGVGVMVAVRLAEMTGYTGKSMGPMLGGQRREGL
jgi:ABC-type glutathione transport system ATPase component